MRSFKYIAGALAVLMISACSMAPVRDVANDNKDDVPSHNWHFRTFPQSKI